MPQAGLPAHEEADAPGSVQKQMADFLKTCPQGVVVLEDVHKLHPQLLPVFINALSEQGSFEVVLIFSPLNTSYAFETHVGKMTFSSLELVNSDLDYHA